MHKINCIIVEDEPLAMEILEDYIQQVPFLNLVAKCNDAIKALEVLKTNVIDLIFLDIHLPKLKGFEFITTLASPPAIIITSAYHEYALKGYEHNVIDYLLKPIEFSRFITAVNKLEKKIPQPKITTTKKERPSIFFNVNKKNVRIYLDEILFVESLKEYVKAVTTTKNIVTKFQLGQIEEILPTDNFLRVHRSFIVALDKISSYSATEIEIDKWTIPIGRAYKENVEASIVNRN